MFWLIFYKDAKTETKGIDFRLLFKCERSELSSTDAISIQGLFKPEAALQLKTDCRVKNVGLNHIHSYISLFPPQEPHWMGATISIHKLDESPSSDYKITDVARRYK